MVSSLRAWIQEVFLRILNLESQKSCKSCKFSGIQDSTKFLRFNMYMLTWCLEYMYTEINIYQKVGLGGGGSKYIYIHSKICIYNYLNQIYLPLQ